MTVKQHYRTVWISDIHLGYRDCKAEYLLDFLHHTKIETLYLVGDIVDMWAMSKQFLWPKSHNELFHYLIGLPEKGTKVIYLPGNHDEPAQKYDGMMFGEVAIHRQCIHTTAAGKRLLLLHGDQFDQEVCFGPIHTWIGDKGYDLLLFLNRWYNKARAWIGFPYWSLAGYIKSRISGANKAIERYRNACIDKAKSMGLDGVVCGHIHHPETIEQEGITYYNDGDWIENCSALTEDSKGNIELVYWTQIRSKVEILQLDRQLEQKSSGQKAA
ncbi:UDP-2,3-diacylglucosamine diphosphatase [Paraneptunicella aestuarii]|uniref:UDP-2,3-diacylglucosamine diphosphatase n=1 Tax=Paraneptunicella aestuarii TaxID=2831148 RepID=UPI001E35E112|nr:UDP-2,3-diacylglucosamine diphosphatase [Paraneptunicella aestuarii]UAA37635.1 UDP-2,3-diacylglucosamine diphosphatase [Paraneptunicella aestuarii]